MIGAETLVDGARRVATQSASIPALRVCLFLFALLAAFAWLRRRPFVSLLFVSTGALLGLGYWLVQMVSPLGFGTDAALTREWAQAGVNATSGSDASGFVVGTPVENSLVSVLAAAEVPLSIVHQTPQVAAIVSLLLLIALPFALIRNPMNAAFAATLALGGGVWPGISPYASIILRPPLLVVIGAAAWLIHILVRKRWVRRFFTRRRAGVLLGLIAGAALGRAWKGGAGADAISALSLMAASMVIASLLRAALRVACSSPTAARRAEALVILCAFGGSDLLWWNPPQTMSGFAESRDPGTALLKPLDWIAHNVPADQTILASPSYSAPIAARGGHRVLFPPNIDSGGGAPLTEPFRRARLLESTLRGEPVERLAESFSVTHLFLGPGEASPPVAKEVRDPNEPRLRLVLVYQDARDFRIFRLAKK